MHYIALAAGFDGTLARDGQCDARCVDALRSLAATGRKLILVSGRGLRDLLERFAQIDVFDFVVAENGAVLYRPATRESAILAQAPSELLVQELERRGVEPLSVGNAVIRTDCSNRDEVGDTARRLGLDIQLLDDRLNLVVMPADVSKASGVHAALCELGLSFHNLVVIGTDAADVGLFRSAQCAVAVNNASGDLKRAADQVTAAQNCDGFLELASTLLSGEMLKVPARHRIPLGVCEDGREMALSPCQDSLVICGESDAGRSTLCQRLIAGLMARKYQCCVVTDALGDIGGDAAAFRAGMIVMGSALAAPRLNDVMAALEAPHANIAVDLAGMAHDLRQSFTQELLHRMHGLHERAGRPHAVLLHDARRLLNPEWNYRALAGQVEFTMIYASTSMRDLPAAILDQATLVVSVDSDPDEAGSPMASLVRSSPRHVAGAAGDVDEEHHTTAAEGAICRLRVSPEATSDSASSSGRTLVTG